MNIIIKVALSLIILAGTAQSFDQFPRYENIETNFLNATMPIFHGNKIGTIHGHCYKNPRRDLDNPTNRTSSKKVLLIRVVESTTYFTIIDPLTLRHSEANNLGFVAAKLNITPIPHHYSHQSIKNDRNNALTAVAEQSPFYFDMKVNRNKFIVKKYNSNLYFDIEICEFNKK